MKRESVPARLAQIAFLSPSWIVLSGSVVVLNKYILSSTPFKFIIALAFAHMMVATLLCRIVFLITPNSRIEIPHGDQSAHMYTRFCVIAALFATSLVASNAALARLDVASVQMIKALNPAVIYALGILSKMERPSWSVLGALSVICGGVIYAVQGVLRFQLFGFALQIIAILADGTRYLYLQATLQSSEGGMDPINILHMIAPIAAVFLWAAGSMWEFAQMRLVVYNLLACLPLVAVSSLLAFTLTMCSYAYIKATSALTMSVSGIVKDVLMIGMLVTYLDAKVSWKQCVGYFIAIGGTAAYTSIRDTHVAETDRLETSQQSVKSTDVCVPKTQAVSRTTRLLQVMCPRITMRLPYMCSLNESVL